MFGKFGRHVRQQYIGYVALFLTLTGGTAYALAGSNTVFSDDIVDGQVANADLALNSIGSARVKDNSLAGVDIADNNLTGTDINESTLNGAQIPGAGGGSIARLHATGDVPGPANLLPGLFWDVRCDAFGRNIEVNFITKTPGTANAMTVASGIEIPAEQGAFRVANGARDEGTVMPAYEYQPQGNYAADYEMRNESGSAHAQSQLVIDAGGKTYSVALHMYVDHGASYCEVFGTATAAG